MNMIYRETLKNGLRIVGETMENYRSVSVGVWIGAGSVFERTPAEAGVSHFIEHMLFKGTYRRSAADIAEEIDSVGGNLNAFTSKECTCFYVKVLEENLPAALDILADLVCNSKFDPGDIEREKGVVLEDERGLSRGSCARGALQSLLQRGQAGNACSRQCGECRCVHEGHADGLHESVL